MEELELTFDTKINISLAPGDTVLFEQNDTIETIGTTVSVAENRLSCLVNRNLFDALPTPGDFIFFSKAAETEVSGIIGYEATTTITNNSTGRAELYAVSSEVFQSSI